MFVGIFTGQYMYLYRRITSHEKRGIGEIDMDAKS
jgi:hypothetical protein